jgi:putative transcriptional regulator
MEGDMERETEKWVSLEEIAEHMGLSKDTIRNYIKKQQMPYYRIGKQYKFKISEIDAWIESGKSASIAE